MLTFTLAVTGTALGVGLLPAAMLALPLTVVGFSVALSVWSGALALIALSGLAALCPVPVTVSVEMAERPTVASTS